MQLLLQRLHHLMVLQLRLVELLVIAVAALDLRDALSIKNIVGVHCAAT